MRVRNYFIVSLLLLVLTTVCNSFVLAQSETIITEQGNDTTLDKDVIKLLI